MEDVLTSVGSITLIDSNLENMLPVKAIGGSV